MERRRTSVAIPSKFLRHIFEADAAGNAVDFEVFRFATSQVNKHSLAVAHL